MLKSKFGMSMASGHIPNFSKQPLFQRFFEGVRSGGSKVVGNA
jgi:hypothetical protein